MYGYKMRYAQKIESQTTTLSLARWIVLEIDESSPIISKALGAVLSAPQEKFFDAVTLSMAEVFRQGRLERWRLKEEAKAKGKEYCPNDNKPPQTPVSIEKAFQYTGCGCIAYWGTFCAARAGFEGVKIVSGDIVNESKPRRNWAGHTVGIFPQMSDFPYGLVFESENPVSRFEPVLTPLAAGDYEKIVRNEAMRIAINRGTQWLELGIEKP